MKYRITTCAVFCLMAVAELPLWAGTTGITDRNALAANDLFNWAQLGPAFSYAPNPSAITSASGLLTGRLAIQGSARRLDQGNGWAGDFLPGEALIYSWPSVPITLSFDSPIAAAGAQIDPGYYGSFSATITAFDAAGTLLGSFSRTGVGTSNEDGSALFLGLRSDQANISTLVFDCQNFNGIGGLLAINQLSVSIVPEPHPGPLLAAGIFALCWHWARTRS